MWERSRGQHNWIQERLDRGLDNQGWKQMFPISEVQMIDMATSDHLPLYLHLNRQTYVPQQKRFRFENVWLREQECRNVVRNGWEMAANLDILGNIRLCGVKLRSGAME